MDRKPIVAGRFYPEEAEQLARDIAGYMGPARPVSQNPTILAMVPHAGYVYSGGIAGETIARARLASTVIMLGPNHTGSGNPLALWPDGTWLFPGGELTVDEELAERVLDAIPSITRDYEAHLREHSLEVQLPFLHAKDPDTRILPICVAEPSPEILLEIGSALAGIIEQTTYPVSILVSSDMSHYITAAQAEKQDGLAIDQILALSAKQLFNTVRENNVSMCGILPMTMGLQAAQDLGAHSASLVRYATSGEVNHDYEQVVGYAGMIVE